MSPIAPTLPAVASAKAGATAAPAEITLTDVEQLAKKYRGCRDVLNERVTALQDDIQTARARRINGIKLAVANAKEAASELERAIAGARHLFEDPKTIVVHGIKVGIVKGRGKIEWTDEASVIERIEEKFPELAEVLIKSTKKLAKKALATLTVQDLKRIGCTATDAGDVVLIKPVDDDVDKLVAALLEEDGGEADEG